MDRREFIKSSGVAGLSLGVPRGFYGKDEATARPPAGGSSLRVGFAERDITPDPGMEVPGGYVKEHFQEIHDPCKVRAVVFDDGRTRVALVGIDALIIPRYVVLAARRMIHERCGIPPDAVLIGASHDHTAGPIGMVQPGQYDNASPLVKKLAYEVSSTADAGYIERVQQEIVTAVCHADSCRVEARCGFGVGNESKVSFNRRLRMKNGLTYTHPGQGNPDIVGYAGPIDPQVGVVGAWDKGGRLLGCIVNFACHATTNPEGFSANWIYYMEKTIRGSLGPDLPVVFLQGCCGDITQVDNLSPYAFPTEEKWAEIVGSSVGAEAVKVLVSAASGEEISLEARTKSWKIKRRVPSAGHVRASYELVQKDPKQVDMTEWVFAKETVLLDALLAEEPAAEIEVQAIQVGPAVFLTNPAEFFVEYGLELKAQSRFPFTFPVELANGSVGYVPTEEALGPHGGGYETRLTSYSNLEVSAGRQMVEAGLELAGQMTPGKVPTPRKAPPFSTVSATGAKGFGTQAWSYGDVQPQIN
jgi:neutral ceramidase